MLSAALNIILKLGINETAFIQFIIFGVTLATLSKFVFGPFAATAKERQDKTKGADYLAEEFHKKTIELHSEYQIKAREVGSAIREIFERERAEANRECELILDKARVQAELELHDKRKTIRESLQLALESAKSQSASVSVAIATKLLGK